MSDGKDKHFWDETRKPWMDLENETRPIRPLKSSVRKNNTTTGGMHCVSLGSSWFRVDKSEIGWFF